MPQMDHQTNVTAFQQICQQTGGYLAEINTEEEYTHLLNFLKTSIPEGRPNAMLGATDREEEGNWVYLTSGDPVSFTQWYTGYGNMGSRGGTYNCMYLIWNQDEGMHDWQCYRSTVMRFVCERNIGK